MKFISRKHLHRLALYAPNFAVKSYLKSYKLACGLNIAYPIGTFYALADKYCTENCKLHPNCHLRKGHTLADKQLIQELFLSNPELFL